MKSESSIEKVAVAVATGSLFLLGAFLIVDGRVDGFLESFERYASTKSWGVVAAVPALTVTYIIGAFLLITADLVFQLIAHRAYDREWEIFQMVAAIDNEILAREFEDIHRTKRLLEGSLVPLLVVAIGIYCERPRLPDFSSLLLFCSIVVGVAALCIPFVTSRLGRNLERVAKVASAISSASTTNDRNASQGAVTVILEK